MENATSTATTLLNNITAAAGNASSAFVMASDTQITAPVGGEAAAGGSELDEAVVGVEAMENDWSYETRFEFVVHGILISSIGIFGLLGNIASIVILTRPQMRNSINTILVGLVSCDTLLIVTSLLMFCFTVFRHTGWHIFEAYNVYVYPYAVPFVYPIALIAQTGSAYLTMAVTVERYLAVCWPLRARSICTIGRAKMAVAVVLSFAIIYNVPRFLEVTWDEYEDPVSGENRTGYFPTELRRTPLYISIYVTWMYLVFMYIVPFTTLAGFNLLTWLEMRRALARRAQLSTQEQKEHNLATMLLVVVLVFFICNLLPLVANILELGNISNEQVIQVSNFLVTINSSVNILIYCTFGKKFRTVFMQIFFGRQPDSRFTMVSTRPNNSEMATIINRSSPSRGSQKYSVSEIRHLVVEDYPSNSTPSLRRQHSTSTISDLPGGKRVHMILTNETTDLIQSVGNGSNGNGDAAKLEDGSNGSLRTVNTISSYRNGSALANGGVAVSAVRKWASRNR